MEEQSDAQEFISNLSFGLIGNALSGLQREAYPIYKKNIEYRNSALVPGEFVPSGIAILLMVSGLDYHLARLKYFRDIRPHSPSLSHTPYFNWKIGDALSEKIRQLLLKRSEKRLCEHLIEMTIIRDCVAHPKIYMIRELIDPDPSIGKQKAKFLLKAEHVSKAEKRKLKRSEQTRLLRLPLVPTWISYPDAVLCALVLNRFLSLLARRYGSPYAWVKDFSVGNDSANFFMDWGSQIRRTIPMNEWIQGFYNSLSHKDQLRLCKTLGSDVEKYVTEPRYPQKPEFLRRAPPWKM